MLCIHYTSRSFEGCLVDARIVETSDDDLIIAAIKLTSLEQARQVVSCLQAGLEGASLILDEAAGSGRSGASPVDETTALRGIAAWLNALFGRLEDI